MLIPRDASIKGQIHSVYFLPGELNWKFLLIALLLTLIQVHTIKGPQIDLNNMFFKER